MRIPLLKITILSVCGKHQSDINIGTYAIKPIEYDVYCLTSEYTGLPEFFLGDYFAFSNFKTLFRRVLHMIALFKNPIISKYMSNYSERLEMDDQMASETIYMDYMRVKNQYMEGSEGVYEHLKEAVHEIVVTNAHLVETINSTNALNRCNVFTSSNNYTLERDPFTSARTITIQQPIKYIENESDTHEHTDDINNERCLNKGSSTGVNRGVNCGV